jgi:hypothetical protein
LGFDIFSNGFGLKTLDTYEGKSLQWTLGALLLKSGLGGFDRPHPRMPNLLKGKNEIDISPEAFVGGRVSVSFYFVMGIFVFLVIYFMLKFLSRSSTGGNNYVRML